MCGKGPPRKLSEGSLPTPIPAIIITSHPTWSTIWHNLTFFFFLFPCLVVLFLSLTSMAAVPRHQLRYQFISFVLSLHVIKTMEFQRIFVSPSPSLRPLPPWTRTGWFWPNLRQRCEEFLIAFDATWPSRIDVASIESYRKHSTTKIPSNSMRVPFSFSS